MHDPIDIIRSAVQVNSVISDEGLSKEYGLAIGRNLDLNLSLIHISEPTRP